MHSKEIGDSETGNRQDGSISSSVTLKIDSAGGASTGFEVRHKTADATATVAEQSKVVSITGGDAYAVLNVDLGQDVSLTSASATVRLTEEPDTANGVTHPFAENHVDVPIDFAQTTTAAQWQRNYDPDFVAEGNDGPKQIGWWDVAEGPAAPAATPASYRLLVKWHTTGEMTGTSKVLDENGDATTVPTKLLGHNGAHTVSLIDVDDVADAPLAYSDGTTAGTMMPAPIAEILNNLTIENILTNSGNPDYFFFDPDSTNSIFKTPTVAFTIKDIGDPNQYKWEVKVRSTSSLDNAWLAFARGSLTGPGSKAININLPSEFDTQTDQSGNSSANLVYRGTYTFEVTVTEIDSLNAPTPLVLDQQTIRSTYLSVPLSYGDNQPGHNFYNEWQGDELHAKLDYYLSETANQLATSVKVKVLDPDWNLLVEDSLSNDVNSAHLNRDLYTYSDGTKSGYYKALIFGEDNHHSDYRSHQNRDMLAANGYQPNLALEWMEHQIESEDVRAYIVWIKRKQLGWSAKHRMNVQRLELSSPGATRSDDALPTVYGHFWESMLNATGFKGLDNFFGPDNSPFIPEPPGDRQWDIEPEKGTVAASINGTFFHDGLYPFLPSGAIGHNGTWSDLTQNTDGKRWSIGLDGGHVAVAREESGPVEPQPSWWPPSSVRNLSYGLGGLACYVNNGTAVPESQMFPWKNGHLADYTRTKYGRVAFVSANNGKDFFFVLIKGSGSGWFPPVKGLTGLQMQSFVLHDLPEIMANHTKSKNNINGRTFAIDNAMGMDGGTHGQIVYAWHDRTRLTTWDGGGDPGPEQMLRDLTVQKHSVVADTPYFLYQEGRGTRSAVDAFVIP